jgi:hypothetical protein
VPLMLTESANSLIPFNFIGKKKHGDKLPPKFFKPCVNFHFMPLAIEAKARRYSIAPR